MKNLLYILEDKKPVACDDPQKWGEWMQERSRFLESTFINNSNTRVSTVFLGLDHNYEDGNPILFETMVFGGEYDSYQKRYCTYEEAMKGHRKVVDKVSKCQE